MVRQMSDHKNLEMQWETDILSAFITIIPKNSDLQKQLSEIEDDSQTGNISPEQLVASFNRFIDQLNQQIGGAPLPLFEFTTGPDNERRTLENYIVAFERYINISMENKLISLGDESPIFKKATRLWEGVLSGQPPIQQSCKDFQDLIQSANALLPTGHHYPNIPIQIYGGKK